MAFSRSKFQIAALFPGFLLSMAAWGAAQDIPPRLEEKEPRGAVDKEAGDRNEAAAFTDVYLNDSFEAADALAKARTLVERGRWSDAAGLLQKAADESGDRLIRVSEGLFTGIRRFVQDEISRWPAEGIAAYRALAERELESAIATQPRPKDRNALVALFDRFFCTSGAARLADLIGQLAIEAGDFGLADYVYRRVLEHHPDARKHEASFGAKLAIVAALNGPAECRTMRGDVAQRPEDEIGVDGKKPTTRLTWKGQERSLGEILSAIQTEFPRLRDRGSALDWPIFGGDATRNRPTACNVDEPGLLWRFQDFDAPPSDAPEEESAERLPEEETETDRALTMFPAAVGSHLFVQRSRHVMALRRGSGAVAWRFEADVRPADPSGYVSDQSPGWDSPTVADGRVFASLPGEEAPFYGSEGSRLASELVCLDAVTGRIIWRVGSRVGGEEFAQITFDSSPLVRHGDLYVVGRRRKSFGFEDCYLFRLNSSDGSVLYRTHLGSASTAPYGARPATRSAVALEGDSVYVCTNLGSVAAVASHTGAVKWLRMYGRNRPDLNRAAVWPARDVRPWQSNPVFYSDGKVFCLPTDSANVLVLSADNGRIDLALPREQLGGVDVLLGARDGDLFGVGAEIFRLNVTGGVPVWSAKPRNAAAVFGRGVVTEDALLIPTTEGLSRFELSDGRRTDISLGPGRVPGGNLLAFPDEIIVAGSDCVSAYVRKSDVWKTLRGKMAEAPNDPRPALEFAEVALGAGEFTEAVSVLDEAMARAARIDSPVDPALSERLLNVVIRVAETASQKGKLDSAVLDKLYNHAADAAHDAPSNVRYRLSFAELFERDRRRERAAQVYQQILRDRSLRFLPVKSASGGDASAGLIARNRIDKLIRQHGPGVYASIEQEADRWLQSGRGGHDEALLLQVMESYPNSAAAAQAMIAYADELLRSGQADAAARFYAQACRQYADRVDRADVYFRLADALAKTDRPRRAHAWLTKGAAEFPARRRQVEGRSVSFKELRDRLEETGKSATPTRPRIEPPLNGEYVREFSEPNSMLLPWFAEEPESNWSRFFLYSAAGLQAHRAADGEPIWSALGPVKSKPELLVARADVAVFATLYEVFALDVATGRRRWSICEYPRHLDDPAADWDDGLAFRTHAIEGNRLVSVRDQGQMTSIEIDTGRVAWTQTRRPAPLGRLRVVGPWVVYHVVQDGQAVLCVVDAETGSWIDSVWTGERRPVEDLFVSLDGQLITVTSQSITAYEPETQVRRWQVAMSGLLRKSSLVLDPGAIYYSEDSGELRKIGLDDGRTLWTSERLSPRGEDDLVVHRVDGSLIVSTTASIVAVDAETGSIQWKGTTPDQPRMLWRSPTASYFLTVDVAGEFREKTNTAYFYDHRHASGLIARNGGAKDLGFLPEIRAVLALDDALVVQTATSIHGYHSKP